MNSFTGGSTRGSMFRGNVGFTPRWMAMNPKTYVNKTDHHGLMAESRCGRSDLIGVQKKEQGRNVPSCCNAVATTTTKTSPSPPSSENTHMEIDVKSCVTNEQKRVKRKRDILLQNIGDLTTDREKEKRRKREIEELSRRSVPTSLLFKQQTPQTQ